MTQINLGNYEINHSLMVSCQKGPTHHAYAWQIRPFWQDTLELLVLDTKQLWQTVVWLTLSWESLVPVEVAVWHLLSGTCVLKWVLMIDSLQDWPFINDISYPDMYWSWSGPVFDPWLSVVSASERRWLIGHVLFIISDKVHVKDQ